MYPYSLQEVGPDLKVSRGYVDPELPSTVPAEIIQEHFLIKKILSPPQLRVLEICSLYAVNIK